MKMAGTSLYNQTRKYATHEFDYIGQFFYLLMGNVRWVGSGLVGIEKDHAVPKRPQARAQAEIEY